MGTTISTQDKATIIGLGVGIGVSLLMLACIVWQFIRFRQQDKKRLEDDKRKKDANSLQARKGEVPYRLGEDIFPSTYPPYPGVYGDELGPIGDEYPIDVNVPIEIPIDCSVPCEVDVFPEPRCGFFPVEESPYPMRPCMMPPPACDCTCDADSEPPSRRIILATIEPKPQPPLHPEPIIIYQPLPPLPPPPAPPQPLPPPPPQQPPEREIIREIYFPQPAPQPQPQPLPQPPPQRRGSWCGPDDWMRVKKVVKKKKQPKKKFSRKYEETESDTSDSSSSDEESISNNRRLTPYDLALPTRVIQIPQQPIQISSTTPTSHPAIYFIQQPAPVPIPAPLPPPAPAPVPAPYSFPVPGPRNAFFAANAGRFDSGQFEEQERRATVAGDECFDCSF